MPQQSVPTWENNADRRVGTCSGSVARVSAWGALLVFFLSACVLDKEAPVRAQLSQWVALGDTSYFRSQRQCTAGVFQTKARNVKSGIQKARSFERGFRLIQQGRAVAFKVEGLSAGALHKKLDKVSRTVGIAVLTSGLGARNCLPPQLQQEFALALRATDVIVMYDPQTRALALFDRDRKKIYYARGDVG